jgi:hypothetical protein
LRQFGLAEKREIGQDLPHLIQFGLAQHTPAKRQLFRRAQGILVQHSTATPMRRLSVFTPPWARMPLLAGRRLAEAKHFRIWALKYLPGDSACSSSAKI